MSAPVTRWMAAGAWLVLASLAARANESSSGYPPAHLTTERAAEDALPAGLYARFETARGRIVARLHAESAPLAVANFVGLAEGTVAFEHRPVGQPFYDGLRFHRVVDGFVVQGGDPLGSGEGGPGYTIADEFTPRLKHDAAGVLALANDGPNTNGSQFYFTLSAANRLNYKHTVFGRVVQGLDVLALIRAGDVLERVRILRVGDEAGAFRVDDEVLGRLRAAVAPIPPRHAALPRLFANEARLDLPAFYPAWLNDKLHHYAEVRGISLFVRIVHHFEGATDELAISGALAGLHEGLAQRDPRSATLVYTTEDRRWHLWLGDGLFGPLGASPDRIAAVKAQLLAGAVAQTQAGFPRRAIDAAVTDLIEALDRGEVRGP